ncbi:MAG TPA: SPFH domain-containing protein, partial [Vicinamibacteria bacterium]|nr:SPFH domain-containing protein [Vicinamibacteria bacterium]
MVDLKGFIKSQLLEIIQWQDDSRDTISWLFPDDDKEIKNGAQLIVRESQLAQFVYLGQFGDTFFPGKHTLTTDNIPVLSRLKGWKYGFESPFKADVYYVNTRLFTGNKWGTANPIMMRDPDFGIVRVRAYGTYDFRVVDPKVFLKEVAGTDNNFRIDEFADTMRSRLVSMFSDSLGAAKIPVVGLVGRYGELGDALLNVINPKIREKYGLELSTFLIENVSVPPEVEQAIDKKGAMATLGNLNDYVKYQMGQSVVQPGGASGGAGGPMEMAMGFAMAQQMMQGMAAGSAPSAGAFAPAAAAPAAPVASGIPELLGPADAAKLMGVSEADVIATIESGDLKAKKIGSQFRITRAALDAF